MKGVVRLYDICDGGCGEIPAPNIEASTDVFVNGKGAHRVGDAWLPHRHPRVQAEGSKTVFVNGKALARIDDLISCGAKCATGSSNVFSG